MIDMLRSVLSDSLSSVYLVGAVLVAVGLVFTILLKEIPLRTSNEAVPSKPEDQLAGKLEKA